MDLMKDQERERFRVRIQARVDQARSEKDEATRKNLLEHLKKTYEPHLPDLFAFMKPKTEEAKQETLLPRTGNPEHDRILAMCDENLKNVKPELRGMFFRVAQQQIARSVAPLSQHEKKLLPAEKLPELEKDPVQARQILFQKESQPEKKTLPRGLRSSELHLRPKEPPRWILEDILPEGLTFLGSPAFGGKSLLSALMVEQFIRGKKFLDRFEPFTGEKCDVLYFDWEKVEADVLRRIEKVTPFDLSLRKGEAIYFAVDTEGQPKIQNKLMDLCNDYLEENPNIKIIVIDTLPRILAEKTGADSEYHWETRTLGALQNWAKVKRIAVLALLHTTKYFNDKAPNPFDSFLGGMGLQGVADCCWLLLRPRGNESSYGELRSQCKVGEMKGFNFELKIENSIWSIMGDLKRESPKTTRTTKAKSEEVNVSEKPKSPKPQENSKPVMGDREAILEILKTSPKAPKEICEALSKIDAKEQTRIRKLIRDMKISGEIVHKEDVGLYAIKNG